MDDTQSQSQTPSSNDVVDDAVNNANATEQASPDNNNADNAAGAILTANSNKDALDSNSNITTNSNPATKGNNEKDENSNKYSSLKSDTNPITIARQKAASEGRPLIVNFDERVVVHTVPYWDPCGETFNDNDDDDGPRGPNCCAIL